MSLENTCSIGFRSGGAGGQEAEFRTCGPDGTAYGGGLVAAWVVPDDDVVRVQGRGQDLLDTGSEYVAVDWTVDHPRCSDRVMAQGCDEGHGVPVTEGGLSDQALAPSSPSPQRGHVGLGPGFINEDKPSDVNLALMRLPAPTLAGDVRPVLFTGQRSFS